MATITLTHLPDVTGELGLPRCVHVTTGLGRTFGDAGDAAEQYRRLLACLEQGVAVQRGEMAEVS